MHVSQNLDRQILSLQCQKVSILYLLNIDSAIFCKYLIDIVSKLKKMTSKQH